MPSQIEKEAAEHNFKQGKELKKQGQIDAALEKYQTALDLDPEYVQALQQLAQIYGEKKRIQESN
jgi:tetratricopeptide (TPR) repeat protein